MSILFIFSKNQLLDLLIVWIVFLVFMLLNLLWSWLFPFFYSLWALFVVVPPVLVGVSLDCLFEMLLSFLGRLILLRTSLLGLPLLCPMSFGLLCVHFNLFSESLISSLISLLIYSLFNSTSCMLLCRCNQVVLRLILLSLQGYI